MKPCFWLLLAAFGCLTACKETPAQGPQGQPPAQVVVVEAWTESIPEMLSLVGTLLPNESVDIQSEIDGTVAGIHFQEGERVEKGQLLVSLDERKLAAAVAEAEASFELSKANFARAQELFRDRLISKQEFDQLSAAFQTSEAGLELKRQQLKDARIIAPFSGVNGARQVSPGQVISKNTVLQSLTQLDPLKGEVNGPERHAGAVRVGQTVAVRVAAFAKEEFTGEIYFISPQVDPGTRTLLVKALIPNKHFRLKPGMFASLNLLLEVRPDALVIPETALNRVFDQARASVFIVDENQTAQPRQVQLGLRLSGKVEILTGLKAGDKVIVEGVQKIGPGAKVVLEQAPVEKLNGQGAAPAKSAH